MPAIGKHSSSVIPDDYQSPFVDLVARLDDLENIFNGEDRVVVLEEAGE
jgi:hypothetical protein